MPKLALNFICKDEAHVIDRMLNSCKSIRYNNFIIHINVSNYYHHYLFSLYQINILIKFNLLIDIFIFLTFFN